MDVLAMNMDDMELASEAFAEDVVDLDFDWGGYAENPYRAIGGAWQNSLAGD